MNIPLSEWVPGDCVHVERPLPATGKIHKIHGMFDGISDNGKPWIAYMMLGGLAFEAELEWCTLIRVPGIKVGDAVGWHEKGAYLSGIVRDLVDAKHVSVASMWPHRADCVVPVAKIKVIAPASSPFEPEGKEYTYLPVNPRQSGKSTAAKEWYDKKLGEHRLKDFMEGSFTPESEE